MAQEKQKLGVGDKAKEGKDNGSAPAPRDQSLFARCHAGFPGQDQLQSEENDEVGRETLAPTGLPISLQNVVLAISLTCGK